MQYIAVKFSFHVEFPILKVLRDWKGLSPSALLNSQIIHNTINRVWKKFDNLAVNLDNLFTYTFDVGRKV